MPASRTSDQILEIARDILASEGLGALSFDAIALRLRRTKQAVLYWYPTKNDLLAAMYLPWLEAEVDVARRSLENITGRSDAIAAYVGAIAGFHLEDLDRFRTMYLLPQTIKPVGRDLQNSDLLEKVHLVTDLVYSPLAAHLHGDPRTARLEAVAIHSAILGMVLMFGLADRLSDPLKHSASDLTAALTASLQSI
jgi:AcrR family transcriptional regulator